MRVYWGSYSWEAAWFLREREREEREKLGRKGPRESLVPPAQLNREIQSGHGIRLGPIGLQTHDTSGEDYRLGINHTFLRGETENTI